MRKLESPFTPAARPLMVGATAILLALTPPLMAAEASASRIEAITLSSGGLAEIHRSAPVDGSDTLRIDVPLEQVDDILKSLVVRDPAGTIGAVTLDGLSPVEETFRRLPFTPEEMGSLPDLAASLQGVHVRASSGGRTVEGVVLGVGTRQAGEGDSFRTERILSVMTDSGDIEVLNLGTDSVLDILDEAMREKVREAASVSGRGRTDDIRSIAIELSGEGDRAVGLSYVVPAPVWKTAYRLVTGGDGTARLQAWAVVENATGEDWQDVALTLSSGAPVTLAQRLHQRYWHQRPEVPVAAGSATPPRPDTAKAIPMAEEDGAAGFDMRQHALAAPEAAMAPQMPASAPRGRAVAQEGETTATYRLPSLVDLPAGQTLSVPFVDEEVPAERVSVFQPEREESHPVAALFLENATAASLPPGLLTVYDDRDGYIGDAQLTGLPAGESRMASFAADRKVEVTTQSRPQETVSRISLVDGTVRATRLSRLVTTYSVKGAADAPRTLIIEHPRRNGWRFSSEALESATPTHHRLRVEIAAGGKAEVVATAERSDTEIFALLDADADALFGWSGAAADPDTASKLADLAELRQQAAQAAREVDDIQRDLKRAADSQARIRDNLAAVPADSTLGQRYVSMLEEEENQIADLTDRRREAEARARELEAEVADFIRNL
ncbi:DUF4139 domain-containing protein [Chelativorans salis]|uniref:DUF4139 domain-containing protein n=1 Tax=Chelativorans salis TaxID=2978478 RepID=A0ABT2LJX0_9HYPH|nr:DUF4139 domain-containing protein [Chelativorans sp. EGI FJ00035]MCT7374309.1 DUF4139 domain-containing protein [Chelativorans sp. EGI FJ00035]